MRELIAYPDHEMTVRSATVHDPAKHARLIESAAALFSRVGFERASVEEIASGADVAKGTVYLYFKSKAELFHAILAELERLIDERPSGHKPHEPQDELRQVVRAQLSAAAESPDLFRCYTSALFGVNRDFQHSALVIFESQKDQVASALCRLHDNPRRTHQIEHRAALFLSSILAAALMTGLEGGRTRKGEDEAGLMALVLEPLA